ncbi:lipid A export permease/ATP-binding protein MsbA [Brackiella oedipodis]|uniref:lipid A export permease/ATP-binding protein MsbA n=1 Tax=Brackiella oedipodis TaxID=124225 RepID=UPI0006857493|nr:lipid A export permease/ATP-binding protein MsbA [Brackiella oedipodis]
MDISLWKRVYERVLPYWKGVIVAIIFTMLASATQPIISYMMKPLLDQGFLGAKSYYIWLMPVVIIGLMLVRAVCSFVGDYLMAWVANKTLFVMRADMFDSLLWMTDEEFRKGDTGRLINRFTVDAGNVTDYAAEAATILVREVFVIISLMALLLYLSWQLTLLIILIFPLSIVVGRYFSKRLRMINRRTIDVNARLTSVIRENIEGQRVIKMFNGYEAESKRFKGINAALRGFGMREAIASSLMSPLTQWVISFSVGAVISLALYQGQHGTLTVGGFIAFITALGQIFDPVKRLTNLAARIQKMMMAAESVFKLIDAPREANQGQKTLQIHKDSVIEFDHVSFAFSKESKNILDNINLTARMGQTIALVGRSGAGKTTLANMLPRFVDASSGAIKIDGTNIEEFALTELRSQLSYVSQQVVLFEGSIADNVRYGAYSEASDLELETVLRAANLWDFVQSLPEGLETKIGENGAWLSGGQRQRIAIARALLKNAPILILDEATSALDNESEKMVQESLDKLMIGRTTFVIAHRLSTIQNADCIVVLDHGQIVEQGTHKELLKNNGLYQSLYKLQFLHDHQA